MNFQKVFFTLLFLSIFIGLSAQYDIRGTVVNEQGEPLDFASVFILDSDYATATIQDGTYVLEDVKPGDYVLKVSFIGYQSVETQIVVDRDLTVPVVIRGTIFDLDQVEIQATRAELRDPVSYSELDKEAIEENYVAQDVPYILRWEPSVTVTSDAGAGIGYTGIRVRGSEASRTNVTINGVPLNDSESQSVFWVNMPDFLTNVESIQLQRGVGVSTNGTSAFGATLQMNTNNFRQNSFANINTAIGSFGTNKISAHIGTGLVNNMYSVEARYSRIASEGYIDRASSRLNSYYLSASRITDGSSLKLTVFSGGERTYQAWNGLPIQYLDSIRTYNTAGQKSDPNEGPYPDEVDNYRQTHGQLVYQKKLSKRSNLNLTGHVTQGRGYFENFREDAFWQDYNLDSSVVERDIAIQRWLDNLFYGVIGTYEYDVKWMNFKLGGGANQYNGDHFGDVIWRETDLTENEKATRYYFNEAVKREANIYSRFNFNILNVVYPFVDLQYRVVDYTGQGFNDDRVEIDIDDNLQFFNPKFGLSIIPNENHKLFAFYGITSREPSRDEYINTFFENTPSPERLRDLELGYSYLSKKMTADVTFYNMQYEDQLIPTGKIGDVGEPIRVNVPESYRRGLELSFLAKATSRIELGYNGTISQNKIANFTEFVDNWDTGTQDEVVHTNTNIAYSPSQLHTIITRWGLSPKGAKHNFALQANFKYVGEQYLDNTQSEFAKLDGFSYLDMMLNYKTKFWKLRDFAVNLQVNNVLNQKFVSNGWVYRFRTNEPSFVAGDPYLVTEGPGRYNLTGVFPQATINFLLGVTAKF